jgi:hypothetical protein
MATMKTKAATEAGTPSREANAIDYKPTAEDQAALDAFRSRRRAKPALPPVSVTVAKNTATVGWDHPDPEMAFVRLANALGTTDGSFIDGVLRQIGDVVRTGRVASAEELNFALSLIHGIEPRDQTEVLLAAQMAAIHNATMTAARRLNRVETIPQQDSASNMLNKLSRTFAAQVDALKKYRSTGEQSIRVQHVTVNEGGQAIVGDVQAGGGGQVKNGGQPHEPCEADERGAPLLGHVETVAAALPSAGGEGMDCVSVPRGTRWSA